jgi:hypothetical protein
LPIVVVVIAENLTSGGLDSERRATFRWVMRTKIAE